MKAPRSLLPKTLVLEVVDDLVRRGARLDETSQRNLRRWRTDATPWIRHDAVDRLLVGDLGRPDLGRALAGTVI